ncbi:MAG: tRNA (adenosine(37)-N6)-threonylcarbamoyltransferase complex ATPase subunit type 1 TsaE [Holosporales bacterium]|jgi:tRNA threonylcarbamoyladenosine biosynthesis protein TsaE|nr:tRNA (adenosine(37)-N6)-threonylcarbamoyltransferase complex ATPase subunit type 1 TsaE [Holosporales bacterium]
MFRYSLDELRSIAESHASAAEVPMLVMLLGDLGSGKTTFSKFFIEPLLIDKTQRVTSPTFNIIQIYDTVKGQIWHVDLYRVHSSRELYDLGLLEAISSAICIVEWPQIMIPHITPTVRNVLKIDLSVSTNIYGLKDTSV